MTQRQDGKSAPFNLICFLGTERHRSARERREDEIVFGLMRFWTLVSVKWHAVLLSIWAKALLERWLYSLGEMLFARMGLQQAAWDLSCSEYSHSIWIVFVCELSSYRPERAWQLGVPFKLPHQRLIEFLLDFNMKAANLAVCFCLGLCLRGWLEKAALSFVCMSQGNLIYPNRLWCYWLAHCLWCNQYCCQCVFIYCRCTVTNIPLNLRFCYSSRGIWLIHPTSKFSSIMTCKECNFTAYQTFSTTLKQVVHNRLQLNSLA